ncbi:MAG TPA: alpha/beta hydrolase [Candidatus Limnocylindria bacterium]|nr:alpha/beta hydrolase [Candidatus Limnocylindria bacterium]
MQGAEKPVQFELQSGGATLRGDELGGGEPVVLLHGLTATRRYVVMGSRFLAKHGRRMIAYDARGHGESEPPRDPGAYEYADLVADLEAVLDHLGLERPALAGSSMGAHTAMAFALAHPERVSALVQITPAFAGGEHEGDLDEWDALADGLARGGVEGFLEAWTPPADERWRETATLVTRQRLERHRHPEAVADALRVVPRSRPFDSLDRLEGLELPVLVVGDRDEADPGHPLAVAEEYARWLPRARLLVEEPGRSPLAWQGAQLSRAIDDFLGEAE